MSFRKALLFISVTIILVAAAFTAYFYNIFTTPVSNRDDFRIYIRPTDTQESILADIRKSDPEAKTKGLVYLLNHRKYSSNIHTGCYTVKSGATPKQVADMLTGGAQTPVRLTINSTRSIGQMAHAISNQVMLDSMEVISLFTDTHLLDSLGYSTATVYCMIIPDTYEVYWNISDKALIKRLIKERDRFWNETRQSKAKSIGLSEFEVMTLASIIEEETSKQDELPIVAGLYINRLKKRMPLQADPTVIFALGGERPKRVLKEHLEINSPYNTYKNAGLPPGPIRFTNTRSIDAVLNYTKHNYLYMCAKEDFSGYHNFATTLSQHNANARRYQRALNKAGIK